jgi:maltose O-acetyltransferase
MNLSYTMDNVRRVLAGRWYLRRCTGVGRLARVYGRPRINNFGEIVIGDKFRYFSNTVTSEMVAYTGGRIEIGDNVFVNYGTSLSAHMLIRIGNDCQIGSYVCLMDNDYHRVEDRTQLSESRPIILCDNVWLGVRVIVLKGVTIGENSVIGSGSVVTKDVPPNCVAAGLPAKVIRTFTMEGHRGAEGRTP